MRLLAVLILVIAGIPATYAQQQTDPPEQALADLFAKNHDLLSKAINDLGRCSALYDIVAMMNEPDMPATAENWRGMSRGARFGAMYLLGQEQIWTGKKAKPYGAFAAYVDPVVETSKAYLSALLDEDVDGFGKEADSCLALQEMQQSIVQMMRDEDAGRSARR
jgi:hypothetical protein